MTLAELVSELERQGPQAAAAARRAEAAVARLLEQRTALQTELREGPLQMMQHLQPVRDAARELQQEVEAMDAAWTTVRARLAARHHALLELATRTAARLDAELRQVAVQQGGVARELDAVPDGLRRMLATQSEQLGREVVRTRAALDEARQAAGLAVADLATMQQVAQTARTAAARSMAGVTATLGALSDALHGDVEHLGATGRSIRLDEALATAHGEALDHPLQHAAGHVAESLQGAAQSAQGALQRVVDEGLNPVEGACAHVRALHDERVAALQSRGVALEGAVAGLQESGDHLGEVARRLFEEGG